MKFLKYLKQKVTPFQNLILIAIAAWGVHIILRVMLLFRQNPYGFPFVSKPDWFIFHAISIDFMWICNSLLVFLLVGILCKSPKLFTLLYGIFHGIILPFTLLDNEVQRFLGGHLSFGLINTYKDTSSIVMFYDYVANDNSVPFLQFTVLALMLPVAFGIYKFLKFKLCKNSEQFHLKKLTLFMVIFYAISFSFVNFIWTGNARMTKLRPIVSLVYKEIFEAEKSESLSNEMAKVYGESFQKLWQKIEGDTLWKFTQKEIPFYKEPTTLLLENESLKQRREKKPNFILILMESERGLNVGYMNPQKKSFTPFLDSLAKNSRAWVRMFTGGVPTTGGVLSTHLGIPHHSSLAQATDLAHVNLPSFASVLTDSGYSTHYMSAADPAWDNLGNWMAKWYTAEHYNRNREDDSTFVDHAISYVRDTLAKSDQPFLATLMTRSNHYPFNFAAGMTEEQKQLPLQQRIDVTMGYADRQVARFYRSIQNEDWFKNTYVIVMADHGFPLGENGVSTMNGGGFSNATWIPFIIHGEGIEIGFDSTSAGQIDIAPTILDLAGIATPNIFMGHNLLRNTGAGLSLGAYSKSAGISLDNFRLVTKYPLADDSYWLFNDADTRQENDIAKEHPEIVKKLKSTLDTLIKISDYTLEKGI